MAENFTWIPFYTEFADTLREYENRRPELLQKLKNIYDRIGESMPTLEKDKDKNKLEPIDIDPFTVFALFNRKIGDGKRIDILKEISKDFKISADIPTDFNGIPVKIYSANFFAFKYERENNDIDNLWKLFIAALDYADNKTGRENFCKSFNTVIKQKCIKFPTLTMGLFWIRPYIYLGFDSNNKIILRNEKYVPRKYVDFISHNMIDENGNYKDTPDAKVYLEACELCSKALKSSGFEYKDFPSLSYEAKQVPNTKKGRSTYLSEIIAALEQLGGTAHLHKIQDVIAERGILPSLNTNANWKSNVRAEIQRHCNQTKTYKEGYDNLFYSVKGIGKGIWGLIGYPADEEANEPEPEESSGSYTKEDFLKEVFITGDEYNRLRSLVINKKNVILQGAPGVGKTYAAKRLAYSIIGSKNENRICTVQFHQNYSYEDFIMGYRPNASGGFELQKGVFYAFCKRCKEEPDEPYFFIIDEINRGNLSKIFGELLMLIETDKRGEEHKLNLVYDGKPFYVPKNLHIIGMMNTADRSLAMIDYALRRRFSFYTMKPAFDNAAYNGFGKYMNNISCNLYGEVIEVIKALNNAIRGDNSLGRGFEIGHSYFIPDVNTVIDNDWVSNVVEYEIIPLIEEYWFDDNDKANTWKNNLNKAIGK